MKQEKIIKENNEIFLGVVMSLAFIGFLFFIFYSLFVMSANLQHKLMDDFCKENNYEKMTDYNKDSPIRNTIQIECDHDKIFYAVEQKRCLELDKWGKCKEYKLVYE